MRIDCHTHAFAEKIAEKAIRQLVDYYQVQTSHTGTIQALLDAAEEAELDAAILVVAATKADQVKPAHDWILHDVCAMSQVSTRIIPFGTYHPDDPDWLSEINRLRKARIRGIKLHPEFQGIDLADPRLNPFFEEVEPDFTLLVHVGDPLVSPDNLSTPTKVAAIAASFPRLRIIAAHMGGYRMWEEALETLAGTNVYLDTSSTLGYIDPDMFKRLITKHGVDRIL
ncbi:MAG TPA: amidohydrolase family protein, partial [Armatimonadota bacterium]